MTLALRIAIVIAMIAWIEPAVAQQYPTKSIRLMIPSPPGGGTDTVGRILKEGLTELWGSPSPMAIVTRLNEATKQIKRTPAVKQQLATLGAIPVEMTPSELGDFLKRDLEKWTNVITAGGIKAE